jgi:anti-sigma factor RsiW
VNRHFHLSCNHITDDAIEQYLLNRSQDKEICAIEEHLLSCANCQERLTEVAAFTGDLKQVLRTMSPRLRKAPAMTHRSDDRRSEARELRDQPIMVFDLQSKATLRRMQAVLVDLSQRGAGLHCGRALRPGRWILVKDDRQTRLGIVRNSIPAGSLWRVGLEFASGTA